jgi:hypothetical protein
MAQGGNADHLTKLLDSVRDDLPAEKYWRLRAELAEQLLALQTEKDGLALPDDCPVTGNEVGPETYESDSPIWNHIKQFFPAHMQNDPDVQRHAGFLLGLYSEKLVGRILRHFGIIP